MINIFLSLSILISVIITFIYNEKLNNSEYQYEKTIKSNTLFHFWKGVTITLFFIELLYLGVFYEW